MKFIASLLTIFLLSAPMCKVKQQKSSSKPISHQQWTTLLKQYVDDNGMVNYEGWAKDTVALHQYLKLLSQHHPNDKNWTKQEQLAYWINAYNAFTIKLMLDNWPTQSIKDIKGGITFVNSIWDKKFIVIENTNYSLNNLEHGIIRPYFKDARIHAAVNCASISCPVLLNEAFEASKLDQQLNLQITKFIESNRNDFSDINHPKLSKIFSWYAPDFKWNHKDIKEFIKAYSKYNIPNNAQVDYLDYNWKINKQ